MENYGLYEDLSLFNGDLLLEDVSQLPAVAQQGLKDGSSMDEAVLAPIEKATVALAYPQNGSQEFGLQDLLTASPTQDLPDPFTATSAWFDTKTDLVDLLTGVEQSQEQVISHNQLTSVNMIPHQDASIESLEVIQALLVADLPMETAPIVVQSDIDSANMVYSATSPDVVPNAEIDILEEFNHEGLEQLLACAPDPDTASLFDAPVLSPVSADDIESVLSSSPSSPSQDVSLQSLFTSFSSNTRTLDTEDVEEVLHVKAERPARERVRPYTIRTQSPASTGSRKCKVDRKERKKEQNRTAALRYREKKRSEQDIHQQECDELIEKNKVLKGQVDEISREIQYLKNLMAEVQKARSKAKKSGGAN